MPFIDVIFQKAYFLLPSFAVAVIVTFLPPVFFFRVTIPLWVTVATFGLLDFQISFLLDALFGKTVAFKVSFLPAAIFLEIPERRIEDTNLLLPFVSIFGFVFWSLPEYKISPLKL